MFSIGDLARQTRVKIPTIRYYEEIGLLAAPERTEGGQRRYGGAARDRLLFIRHLRDLGFPLGAVRELLRLQDHPDRPCADADAIAASQLGAVREKLARLQRLEGELSRIVAACGTPGPAGACNLLGALRDHAQCAGEH